MSYARLRAVAETDLDAAVPSCPGWSVADLTRHVAEVYLHKSAIMRDGAEPGAVAAGRLATAAPIPLLDRAYAQLVDEFAGRSPQEAALTWYATGSVRRVLDPADGAGDGHPPHRCRAR